MPINAYYPTTETMASDVKTSAIPCLQNVVQVTLSMSHLFQDSEDEINIVTNFIYWSIYVFISFCSDTINRFYKAKRS